MRPRRMVVGKHCCDWQRRLPPPFLVSFSFATLFPFPTMAALPDADPQSTSSHMMKTTKRGRPFLKVCNLALAAPVPVSFISTQDTLDLFATLIVSLQLGPHKQFFRTFPHSFSTWVPLHFMMLHTHPHLFFPISKATRQRRIWLLSNFLNQIGGQILGSLPELSQQLPPPRFR